jgi:hypothetical protein
VTIGLAPQEEGLNTEGTGEHRGLGKSAETG